VSSGFLPVGPGIFGAGHSHRPLRSYLNGALVQDAQSEMIFGIDYLMPIWPGISRSSRATLSSPARPRTPVPMADADSSRWRLPEWPPAEHVRAVPGARGR